MTYLSVACQTRKEPHFNAHLYSGGHVARHCHRITGEGLRFELLPTNTDATERIDRLGTCYPLGSEHLDMHVPPRQQFEDA